jgi:hypothetical protein
MVAGNGRSLTSIPIQLRKDGAIGALYSRADENARSLTGIRDDDPQLFSKLYHYRK